MNNLDALRADYWLNKFYEYALSLKNSFTLQSEMSYVITVTFALFTLLILIRKLLIIKRSLKQQSMLLELTPPSLTEQESYTTDQLFSIIHAIGNQTSIKDKLLGNKARFSLEIVSTQNGGIRYIVRTSPKEVNTLKKSLLAYLPYLKVKTVNEYLPENPDSLQKYFFKIIEFKLSKHFAFALKKQSELDKYDPIAYLTGMMTKLAPSELISLQLVLTPIKNRDTKNISKLISSNGDVIKYLRTPKLLKWILFNSYRVPSAKSPSETEIVKSIDAKINQPLFETTIRLLIIFKDKESLLEREQGFKSSFSAFSSNGYQAFVSKKYLNINKVKKYLFFVFKKRLQSLTNTSTLSISEVSGIYHFPYTSRTNTENLVKSHSKELPAPLSLKRDDKLDVMFAKNIYGETITNIGLNLEERRRHMYILGATGTGKSTLLLSMVNQDIQNNKGLAVIDPHGDLIEKILPSIPERRLKDIIYFNPDDIGYPVGLNLLELSKDLSDEDALREKEFITESVISLFHKLYPEKYSGPRMEYILRNTIHTAFNVPGATLFTVYKLLTNPKFRKGVTSSLTDENLSDFWKYEFNKAGDYQKVKMISPITNKIGRFLFSPSAKRILEQEKSTINFDDIMDNGKVLLCNLSKGKVGEDTSEVFGILIMTKIQLAALKRARTSIENRKDFYLYVDEFQNFATPSFAQILSEARKYRLNAILAHQTTSQLEDKDLVNVTLANTGTIICFRTANPEDEKLILPQFHPYIQQGEIANLPSFHFYMKINALNPEEPFSGQTIPVLVKDNKDKVAEIIKISRTDYAKKYPTDIQTTKNKPSKIKMTEQQMSPAIH